MATLLTLPDVPTGARPPRLLRPPSTGPLAPLALAGLLAAGRAAALGMLPVTLLVVLGWASAARSGADAASALRWAGDAWLVAHHAPLAVPGGTLGLTPLGLVALPGAALWSAARGAARSARPPGRAAAACLLGVLAGCYAGLAALVAVVAATPQVRVAPLLGAACAGGLALAAAGCGVASGAGLRPRLRPGLRSLLAASAAGVATLTAAGGLLATGSVVVHAARIGDLSASLDPGLVGGLLLTLLGALLAPNAAVWGASLAVGPGFAVGEGTTVSAFLSDLSSVPALPLLGALPDPGAAPDGLLLAYLAPVASGVAVTVVLLRRRSRHGARAARPLAAAGHAGLAGLAAGGLLGLLAGLAGGPLGGGRLSAVGPSPWQVGLAAGLELALVAGVTAYVVRRLRPAGS